MPDGTRPFFHNVPNDSGFVQHHPNVGREEDIIQGRPINVYAESVIQEWPLGFRLIRGQEEWLYCQSDSTGFSALGTPIQSAAAIHAEMDDDIAVGVVAAIGDFDVSLTSTTNLDTGALATAGGMKEGFLIVNDVDGEGQLYKIKDNEAMVTTAEAVYTLYDPLTIALTTSSQVGLIQNPCANVLATTAVVSGMFIGVNQIAVTASYYFWAKVRGPAPAIAQTAIAKGTYVVVGTTAAKFDPSASVTTELIVGEPITPGVTDTESFIVMLYGR